MESSCNTPWRAHRSQERCSFRIDWTGNGPLFLSPHRCSANIGLGANIWRWGSGLHATGNVGLSSLLWLQSCIPRKSEVCDVNSVPGGQQSSIRRTTSWSGRFSHGEGQEEVNTDWLCFQASIPLPRAEPVAGRMWEATGKPSDILFLENKCFQRPWQVFSLNKASFYEGDFSSLQQLCFSDCFGLD